MPFKIKFADITKYEGDAIVNSLGVDGRVKGALCHAILKVANSEALKTFVDSKVKNKVGDIHFSKGYDLPAKNIIHVVSPFKKDDDECNTKLKQIYESIIDLSIKLGYKDIAIPFLGTGANGYSDDDAYDAITTICADFISKEEELDKDILDITLIVKASQHIIDYQEKIEFLNERMANELKYNNLNKMYSNSAKEGKISKTQGDIIKENVISCLRVYKNVDSNKFLTPKMLPYRFDYDFVEDYIYQKGIDDKILAKDGLDRKVKYKMRKGKKLFNIDIFRIATSLKMEKEEIIQFMMLCNRNFDPSNPLDVFFANYLNGMYNKQKNLYLLSILSIKECGVSLFWDDKEKEN